MACKYFLPLNRLAFHFVDGLLCCAEAFLFDVAYFSFLIFVAFAFDVKSKKKKSLPILMSRSLPYVFSSRTFVVSSLTFFNPVS